MHPTPNQQRLYRIHAQLMDWFNQQKRDLPWRTLPREAYKVWISEIMLQQTQVETVIPYFQAWMAQWPAVHDLAQASEDQVLKAWEGLGYYARARNILKTAQLIAKDYQGCMPETYEELIKLPGIGPYTAAAIASYTSGQAVGAVDANVLRVLSRLNQIEWTAGDPKSLKDCQHALSSAMEDLRNNQPAEGPNFQAGPLNEALIELGALICQAKTASCLLCPLKNDCLAWANDRIYDFPLPKEKVFKKDVSYSLLILYRQDLQSFAVEQRSVDGLLGGLWQFPLLEGLQEPEDLRRSLEDQGYQLVSLRKMAGYRHVFTHLIWNLEPYLVVLTSREEEDAPGSPACVVKENTGQVQWVSEKSLMDLPFSSSMTRLRDWVINQDLTNGASAK